MSYFRPKRLEDAMDILASEQPRILAGCTDLFPATGAPTLTGPLMDITDIASLQKVECTATGWRIGAGVTWSNLVKTDLPPAFDGLIAAAKEIGSIQIQNSATVCGNLCNASPAADGVPPLLTLDAEVELTSKKSQRCIRLNEFIKGPRQIDLATSEMMTAILIPGQSALGHSGFYKLGARKYLVISIVMAAARLQIADKIIQQASLSVGACSPVAQRLLELEARLVGVEVGDAAFDAIDTAIVSKPLAPLSDVRADAAYRNQAATIAVKRALHLAMGSRT